ncbi:hypothetical protein DFQ28_008661 [Apophysomyces sp. BC1034]|nr:hypothetical protein DFQ30_008337 [Apophysomyces sp. BC1015]KAG0174607.1 hypothetical protein DFQ29_007421 [Apophysomyces sp. BC1021]KAG0185854.1 hypothetical protein DFQ28_008661 [Apophysomyces sp. BC1034]
MSEPKQETPEPIRTLQEAFPDVDKQVIEAILDSQQGKMEPAFEILLGMSDPQTAEAPKGVEEQLRMDEAYARQLALEQDISRTQRQRELQRSQSQSQSQQEQGPQFNLQEELPVIKEKVIEAGIAAKKKVLDFYNQIKATREANLARQEQARIEQNSGRRSTDVLAGNMAGLQISNNAASTRTRNDSFEDLYGPDEKQTQEQLRKDEIFARRLAEEEKFWHRKEMKRRQQEQKEQLTEKSRPLSEEDGLEDGDPVTLSAPDRQLAPGNISSSYVISDDMDDLDDLLDVKQNKTQGKWEKKGGRNFGNSYKDN